MSTIRPDVSAFSRTCERLLSEYVDPPLNDDERQLVGYYLEELTRHLKANLATLGTGASGQRQSISSSGDAARLVDQPVPKQPDAP